MNVIFNLRKNMELKFLMLFFQRIAQKLINQKLLLNMAF